MALNVATLPFNIVSSGKNHQACMEVHLPILCFPNFCSHCAFPTTFLMIFLLTMIIDCHNYKNFEQTPRRGQCMYNICDTNTVDLHTIYTENFKCVDFVPNFDTLFLC